MIRPRYRFFRSQDYRASAALALARAEERIAAEGANRVRFRWVPDEDPDLSWADARTLASIEEVLGCIMEVRCVHCSNWRHAESLWSIIDPDRFYQRVIEAELACEYFAREN